MLKAKFLLFKLLVVLSPYYYVKEKMSLREAKHKKFGLFCTPYYLRHGIVIFSDNSLPLDVTVLFLEIEKKMLSNLFLKFHIQTGSVQQP